MAEMPFIPDGEGKNESDLVVEGETLSPLMLSGEGGKMSESDGEPERCERWLGLVASSSPPRIQTGAASEGEAARGEFGCEPAPESGEDGRGMRRLEPEGVRRWTSVEGALREGYELVVTVTEGVVGGDALPL